MWGRRSQKIVIICKISKKVQPPYTMNTLQSKLNLESDNLKDIFMLPHFVAVERACWVKMLYSNKIVQSVFLLFTRTP